jgi:DNA-binding CsgD family transcriptional regulator
MYFLLLLFLSHLKLFVYKVRDVGSNVLTKREEEVALLTIKGCSSREIGGYLGISHQTVEKHRSNIKDKLDTHTSFETGAVLLDYFNHTDVRLSA